jgi:micrococcal nuclease
MLFKLIKKVLLSAFFIACYSSQAHAINLPKGCPQLSQLKQSNEAKALKQEQLQWLADGDTIYTQSKQKLRLLHINTPELNPKSAKPAEPLAAQAKSYLKHLLGKNSTFYWLSDRRNKDKYQRKLALVFNQQGIFVNAALVAKGLAHTLLMPPNTQYWQCIKEAEKQARKASLGIWALNQYQAKAVNAIEPYQGFQLVSGKISQVINSKKYRWLVLNEHLWVGIKRKDFHYFSAKQLELKVGDKLTLRGYTYRSHKKLRMKLEHPAMLY